MKKAVQFLLLISGLIMGCEKSSEHLPTPDPKIYSYSEALEALGIKVDSVYGYNRATLPDWTPAGIVKFNSDGTVTESSTPSWDTLTYSIRVRVVQPEGDPLPQLVFYPEDVSKHSALSNEPVWRNLNFLRYTTDSAHLQNHFPTLIFRSLSPNKYEGDMEIRKM